jgi:hypothetical protein
LFVCEPSNPNDFYFVTTASFTGNSRLWRLRFVDVSRPELGGTIDMLLAGGEGPKMMDISSIRRRIMTLAMPRRSKADNCNCCTSRPVARSNPQ